MIFNRFKLFVFRLNTNFKLKYYKMISKKYYLLLLIVVCVGNTYSQGVKHELSLKQMIDTALSNNNNLKSVEKNGMLQKADLEILRTEYLPMVRMSALFSYWDWLTPNKKRLIGNSSTDMYTKFSVVQKIYDWGERKLKKSVVGENIKLNNEVKRKIRSTIIYGVSNTFLELLKIKAESNIYRNSISQLQSQLKFTENLYLISKASEIDILRVKIKIEIEKKKLKKSVNAENSKLADLKNLCYLKGSVAIKNHTDLFTKSGILSSHSINADSLYKVMYGNNSAIKMYDINIEKESLQKELYKVSNRPVIYTYAESTWEDSYIPFGSNFNYNLGVGVVYTLPFLGGRVYKSKMLKSDIKVSKMGDEKRELINTLKREMDLSINEFNDVKDKLEHIKQILNLSEKALKNASIIYQNGQGNLIDVLDAQSVITETRLDYECNVIELLQVLAKVHFLSGKENYPITF